MVGIRLFLFITLVILLDPVFLQLYRNVMKPVGVKYLNNPKRITNVSFSIKARSRNDYRVNFEADLVQPLRNFSARIEVSRFYNIYRPFIPNITGNVCEFLANRKTKKNPLFPIARKLLRHTSNLNKTCPYTKNIIIRDFRMMPEAFPSLFPQGKYKIQAILYDDTEMEPYVGTFMLFLEVLENIIRRKKQQ